ncbi:MAG: hypothetical protein ACKVH8_10905 [Pirellulales bacterium]
MIEENTPNINCLECGAENNAFSSNCWLCYTIIIKAAESVEPDEEVQVEPPAFARKLNQDVSRFAFFMLSLGLAVVGVGIGLLNPGMLIPFVLFVCAPMIAIGVAVRRGMTSTNFTAATVSSVFTYLFLALLLAIAALIGLFVLCLSISAFSR